MQEKERALRFVLFIVSFFHDKSFMQTNIFNQMRILSRITYYTCTRNGEIYIKEKLKSMALMLR